ncbi:hypothetical protein HQ545_06620 [Candidatus Woesearchaeota archaeon]|nr:hypothetical protein [Candidatus Woesearchaeota archaeon]
MPDDTPTDTVLSMKQQGLSNDQIIASFQRAGYNTNQILDAMNQADIRLQTNRPFNGGNMADPNMPAGMPPAYPAPGMPVEGELPLVEGGTDTERIEELAEAIIEEKWTDLMENINRIVDWKDKTETRITQMETVMKSMKDDFDKMHTSVLEKVGEYDKHIGDVGTEVKALEKVFQKVLPGFIENVSELSRITEDMKQHSKPQ